MLIFDKNKNVLNCTFIIQIYLMNVDIVCGYKIILNY